MATNPTNDALIAQFKSGMDDKSAAAMAERLATAEKERDELKAKPDLSADLQAANERAEQAEKERDEARADLDDAHERLQGANEELASVTEREAQGKPRSLPAPKDPKPTDPDEIAEARTKLRAKIEDADDVEIMFSDGRKQIKELGVRTIAGDAWKDSPIGLMLAQSVDLHGVGIGNGGTLIVEGYALLLDGEVASYTPRDPLQIQPGAHVRLENDIYF